MAIYVTDEEQERVILVGVELDPADDCEKSLEELSELAKTAGAVTVGKMIQPRDSFHPATYIGKGKLEELRTMIQELGATGIICDDELSPAQLRNLEDVLDTKIMDRTMVILDIFAARASSSEGKIQVEMAQLKYRSTRLAGLGITLSRLGGGIGTRGPGEKKIETDRRIIRDRISHLSAELKEIKSHRDIQRQNRENSSTPVAAIVGYTNAGKSTLLNRLTDAGVLSEDKLFATLDPTTRVLELSGRQQILVTDTETDIAKYTIKDSVFTNLFQDKKYLIQLYKTIHPEDKDVTEAELKDITIHNILTDDIYNDLGFLVGDRLVILVEAQSTWTENIVIRSLIYLMTTYQDYFKRTKQNLYASRKIKMPKPELYVIYTGDRKEHPEYISLSDAFFGGHTGFIDAKVKVLYGTDEDDIISQYVTFTKVYNEQMKQYGRTRETIMETIRICKDKNVLREYLQSREKEVVSIMLAMYDEKEILREYIEYEKYHAAEEAAKKAAQEATKKATKEAKENAIKMIKAGKLSIEDIPEFFTSLTQEDIKEIEKELMQTV